MESYEWSYSRHGDVGRNVPSNQAIANQNFSKRVSAFSGYELEGANVFGFDLKFGNEFTASKCEP